MRAPRIFVLPALLWILVPGSVLHAQLEFIERNRKLTSRTFGLLICILVFFAHSAQGQITKFSCDNITNRVIHVPHMVVGRAAGVDYSTTVTISNAGTESADIKVSHAWDIRGTEPVEDNELAPGATRVIEFQPDGEEPVEGGWLRVKTDGTLSVVAHIQGEAADGSIVSEVSVPGVEPGSKFSFPVFRNDFLADNTGVAISSPAGGLILAELRDLDGNLIATRELAAQSESCEPNREPPLPPICYQSPDFWSRYAVLLQELFNDLPEGFQRGFLTLEHTSYLGSDDMRVGPQFPFGMAVVALYTNGLDLRAAPATPIDIPVRFEVAIRAQADAADLLSSYGLSIERQIEFSSVTRAFVDSTVATARVLAVNPQVNSVCFDPLELDEVTP